MAHVSKVCVLGAGAWGTGLAAVVARHADSVVLWDKDTEVLDAIATKHENSKYLAGIPLAENIGSSKDIAEAIKGSDAIVIALPTVALPLVLEPAKDLIGPDIPLISATKGLGEAKLQLPSDIIKESLGRQDRSKIFVLSGPSFAKEAVMGLPTAVSFAGENVDDAAKTAELFHAPQFRTYPNDDITGVEVAGAFKNVIAIAAGAVDGLGFGDNARAAIITRGSAEIMRVGTHFGAKPLTFQGLAGMGDLVLTCTSRQSRNCRLGYHMAQGMTRDEALAELGGTAEGMYTAKSAHKLSEEKGIDLPISNEVYAALYEGKPPKEVAETLMTRPMRVEVEH